MSTLRNALFGLFSVIVLPIMLLGSCSDGGSQVSSCDTTNLNKRIYLIAADSMKLIPKDNPDEYTFVLEEPQDTTLWYLDRPLTGYGEQDLGDFCDDIWPCLNAVADPNAVAVLYGSADSHRARSGGVMPSTIVLKLENLVYEASTSIQFDATVLRSTTDLSGNEALSFTVWSSDHFKQRRGNERCRERFRTNSRDCNTCI